MSVTAAEVAALKREGEAMLAAGAPNELHVLQSLAEVIGYLTHCLRADGLTEDEVADGVEVVVRASEIDRQELRAVRDTLRTLGYSKVLITRLTKLAARAKPRPPPRIRPPRGGRHGFHGDDGQQRAPSSLRAEGEAEAALRILRPVKRATWKTSNRH